MSPFILVKLLTFDRTAYFKKNMFVYISTILRLDGYWNI